MLKIRNFLSLAGFIESSVEYDQCVQERVRRVDAPSLTSSREKRAAMVMWTLEP